MEASVVIGSCASAPPLPLRPVSPGQGGSLRGRLRCCARFLVAGCPQAPGGRLSCTFQFNQPDFCPGGSHPWAEIPGERKTGAGTLLPACGPQRCPESKSFSLTATPFLRPRRSSLPGLGRRRLEGMVPCAALLPAQDLSACVSSHWCPSTTLSDSMLASKPRPVLCQNCAQNSPFTIAHQPLILRACLTYGLKNHQRKVTFRVIYPRAGLC